MRQPSVDTDVVPVDIQEAKPFSNPRFDRVPVAAGAKELTILGDLLDEGLVEGENVVNIGRNDGDVVGFVVGNRDCNGAVVLVCLDGLKVGFDVGDFEGTVLDFEGESVGILLGGKLGDRAGRTVGPGAERVMSSTIVKVTSDGLLSSWLAIVNVYE